MHGGATPIKHGRYAKVTRQRVGELIEAFASDPDPLNLLPEVGALRALLVDFIERYDAYTEALVAWHDSFRRGEDQGKPVQVLDISAARKMLVDVARIVDIIHRQKREGSLSMETFNRVIEQMGLVVARHVKDPEVLQRIDLEWSEIRVSGVSGGSA